MASNSALKTAAVLMIVLLAGQLLVATPVAADADGRLLQGLVKRRSLLQVPSGSLCNPGSFKATCFQICIRTCDIFIEQDLALLGCQTKCFGQCRIN